MKNVFCILWLCTLALTACGTSANSSSTLESPDGRNSLLFEVENGKLYYSVNRDNKPVINRSLLGFQLSREDLSGSFRIDNVTHSYSSTTWEQVWGEEITVDDTYHQMEVALSQTHANGRKLNLIFRLYNDGAGFRYEFPEAEDIVIMDELTEFNLAGNYPSWSIPTYHTEYYEGLYRKMPVSAIDTVPTPLTMKVSDNLYISIHEANLTDYAVLNLTPLNNSTRLKADLTPWSTGEKVFMTTPGVTPWRIIIMADTPGDLLLSRLMLNLNEPNKIADTSWIKPGRYIGIWWGMHMEAYTWAPGLKHGATTANTMRYIDFAAKHGFSGVLVEGWNLGWENDWTREGDKFSFTQSYPGFDLEKVTKYAAIKGVNLVGHHETGGAAKNYESQLEEAFALYHKYGVNAVKTGYVGFQHDGKEWHSSQYGVRHYRKVIETAAKYQIMMDNHEPVMPTGLQRTYPNLMTQEGVRGQEYDAWSRDGGNPPDHTTIIPFTRRLAGPMDFMPGTFKFENPVFPNTRVWTTLAKQLALSVVIFSPLQMASDMIENYENNPAFEFITTCPATWAETVVPEARIGEYVTIARKDRDSENWFVGSITNENSRTLQLPLSFLDEGATYRAKIFRNGEGADYETNPYPVTIEEQEVTSTTVLNIHQATSSGTAIILTKL
ncbi:MAG: glycoside hydrolase family 97 protein [Tannerellaceae bacterium]|nr:glycoside hydrolase family 97 protein [Tannerellaceae bacterium]